MEWRRLEHRQVRVGNVSYHLVLGGTGSPVLLLHGFPQTHFCWRKIAPRLAGQVSDQKEYGFRSLKSGQRDDRDRQ